MYLFRKQARWIGLLVMMVLILQLAGAGMASSIGVQVQTGTEGTYRISGNNRYTTAIEASKEGWETSKWVVLARGDDFADALTSGPLAGMYNAPILLTPPNILPASVLLELERLGATDVIIIGGYGAVSESVQSTLFSEGYEVHRLFGANRYATSIAIAEHIAEHGTLGDAVHLASGAATAFADALSISGIATMRTEPILLVTRTLLPNSVAAFIADNNMEHTYAIGGPAAIDDSVFAGLPNPVRLGGATRYQTNLAVLNYFSEEFNTNRIFVATGANFPDALTGGVLAARFNAPLWLIGTGIGPLSDAYLKSAITLETRMVILGGPVAVSVAMEDAIRDRLEHWQDVIVALDEAEQAIVALPELVEMTLADKDQVAAARALVDSVLAKDPLAVIEGLDALLAAEAKMEHMEADVAAAEAVEALIEDLPIPSELTLDDQDDVDAARTAYTALTADQKALVTNLGKLLAAEDRIQELIDLDLQTVIQVSESNGGFISGWGWPNLESVGVVIERDVDIVLNITSVSVDEEGSINLWLADEEFVLEVGDVITVDYMGEITKSTTLKHLLVTQTPDSRVIGEALPGSTVRVTLFDGEDYDLFPRLNAVAEPDGTWEVNFEDLEVILDTKSHGVVEIFDGRGNATMRYWSYLKPVFSVAVEENFLYGYGWRPYTTLSMKYNNVTGVIAQPTDEFGYFHLNFPLMVAGDVFIISDGQSTQTLTVTALAVQNYHPYELGGVDYLFMEGSSNTDQYPIMISVTRGGGPWGPPQTVGEGLGTWGATQFNWSANFALDMTPEPGDNITIQQVDENGNSTVLFRTIIDDA